MSARYRMRQPECRLRGEQARRAGGKAKCSACITTHARALLANSGPMQTRGPCTGRFPRSACASRGVFTSPFAARRAHIPLTSPPENEWLKTPTSTFSGGRSQDQVRVITSEVRDRPLHVITDRCIPTVHPLDYRPRTAWRMPSGTPSDAPTEMSITPCFSRGTKIPRHRRRRQELARDITRGDATSVP